MDEKIIEVYGILNGIDKLTKSKYNSLIDKYGFDLVSKVIDSMLIQSKDDVSKFEYYLFVRANEALEGEVDLYKSYVTDMNYFPRLSYEENQMLASDLYDIVSEINTIFESVFGNDVYTNGKKIYLIADKYEYFITNSNDVDKNNRLKELYTQFINKRNKLVEGNLRLVIYIAKQYNNHGQELPLAEIIQFGNLGLMRSVEKYNPKYNSAFSSYAYYWIFQSIKRGIKDAIFSSSNIPYYLMDLNSSRLRAITELSNMYGRIPSREEIANYMNISLDKLSYIEESMMLPLSLYTSFSATDEDSELVLIDCIEDENASLEQGVFARAMSEQLMNILMNEENFTDRELMIIKYLNGFEDGIRHTYEETGQLLGVSKQRIKQIDVKVMRRLKGLCKRGGMNDYL